MELYLSCKSHSTNVNHVQEEVFSEKSQYRHVQNAGAACTLDATALLSRGGPYTRQFSAAPFFFLDSIYLPIFKVELQKVKEGREGGTVDERKNLPFGNSLRTRLNNGDWASSLKVHLE